MGTVNVLESARVVGGVAALVSVTTDKCYRNNEWTYSYREDDHLGGHDPYSSSKACAELVTAAYRSSFHGGGGHWIASARAGNVIGGGDWAGDRIVPDALRALDSSTALLVRSPDAVRPWQHVLEPLSGYLLLAERLVTTGAAAAAAWNFGPEDRDARPVSWILERLRDSAPSLDWTTDGASPVHEAKVLKLDSSRAQSLLGWRPHWSLSAALKMTVEWHRRWRGGESARAVSLDQIAAYSQGPLPHD
jgi:CDP-glucose 4,6-dehydratase